MGSSVIGFSLGYSVIGPLLVSFVIASSLGSLVIGFSVIRSSLELSVTGSSLGSLVLGYSPGSRLFFFQCAHNHLISFNSVDFNTETLPHFFTIKI